jgi:hypothetical protein
MLKIQQNGFRITKGSSYTKTQWPNGEPKTCSYIYILRDKEVILPLSITWNTI